MGFLRSPDPDGTAVIHAGRRYPVRGGVFLVPAEHDHEFLGWPAAGDISSDTAAELVGLGSWDDGDEPEPEQPADPAAADDGDHQDAALTPAATKRRRKIA